MCMSPSYIHFDMSPRLPCGCSGQYHPQFNCKIETEQSSRLVARRVYYSEISFSLVWLHRETLPFRHGLFCNVKLFSGTDHSIFRLMFICFIFFVPCLNLYLFIPLVIRNKNTVIILSVKFSILYFIFYK